MMSKATMQNSSSQKLLLLLHQPLDQSCDISALPYSRNRHLQFSLNFTQFWLTGKFFMKACEWCLKPWLGPCLGNTEWDLPPLSPGRHTRKKMKCWRSQSHHHLKVSARIRWDSCVSLQYNVWDTVNAQQMVVYKIL